MRALGCREDALDAGKELGCLKDAGLGHGYRLHQAVVIELGEDGAHAVVAETAGVVRRGDEVAAQGVHLGERAYHAGVAEVVGVDTAGEAGAGGRFHGDDAVIRLTAELFAHKRRDEASQVGAAAGAADDHVGLDPIFVQSSLGLQADDGLVKKDLVQDRAQHIAVAGVGDGNFHRLGDGAAQGAGGSGMLRENLSSHIGGVGRRGCHGGAVGAHDLTPEGLLLIADLYHVNLAVQAEVGAGHGEGRAPLAGAGLGGDALEALLLCVVGLGDGGIQLVAAAGIVALKLVIDVGRGLELLLQAVSAD